MDREKLLIEYRLKKKRENFIINYKDKIKNLFTKRLTNTVSNSKTSCETTTKSGENEVKSRLLEDNNTDISVEECLSCDTSLIEDDSSKWTKQETWIKVVYFLLWFILWVTFYALFIEIGFGTIYFIFSAFCGMYINTRTTPKKPGEVSAYSVFNKNCESIDGTLKAEHLQQQLLFGAGALR